MKTKAAGASPSENHMKESIVKRLHELYTEPGTGERKKERLTERERERERERGRQREKERERERERETDRKTMEILRSSVR
jgi:RNA-binding protein 25